MGPKKRKQPPTKPQIRGAVLLSQLPEYLFSTAGPASAEVPWFLRLYAQVIRRAAVDYVLYYGHPIPKLGVIGDEAYDWLFVNSPDFVTMCEHLDVEPYAVREYTYSMTESDARSLRGLDFDDEGT